MKNTKWSLMEYTELALLLVKTLCRTDRPTNQPNQPPPWSTVLPEKLIGSQLIKKFPAFMEPERFITAFTSSHHLSLSWNQTNPVHANPSYVLKIHSNIILPCMHFSYLPHVPHPTCILCRTVVQNKDENQKKLMQLQFAN